MSFFSPSSRTDGRTDLESKTTSPEFADESISHEIAAAAARGGHGGLQVVTEQRKNPIMKTFFDSLLLRQPQEKMMTAEKKAMGENSADIRIGQVRRTDRHTHTQLVHR